MTEDGALMGIKAVCCVTAARARGDGHAKDFLNSAGREPEKWRRFVALVEIVGERRLKRAAFRLGS